ncbi:hypothetical protein BEH94_05620 [Candidatus Altiarchaeales archaeon WOR_SM1_SCG]|nr:hypothetical protein BEH94_05620 [Candidatus Altiarchaeales archaeon WOR_SM1_SCG]
MRHKQKLIGPAVVFCFICLIGSVSVYAEINATITAAIIESGNFTAGDGVDADVCIENIGNETHTFCIGYSVRDGNYSGPDGGWWDISCENISLHPKSGGGSYSGCKTLTWIVNSTAPSGSYYARVAVWANPPSPGDTWLDYNDTLDAFNVVPPTVDATITLNDVYPDNCKEGDSVYANVFVNNTGDLDVCFDIDFYVYPSDGGFWNGSSELLCLDVGETGYETLNWTVPSEAPTGYYGAFVYVLDFGTPLDSDTEYDAFNVVPPTVDATITLNDVYPDNCKEGDSVYANVFVNNTGDLDVCFDIDFYVYPSDGGFWNGSSELLCLDVGETGYETLNWTVPSEAPTGYYGAFVYVLDFGTPLDSDTEYDAFNVVPPTVDATITLNDVYPDNCKEGDSVYANVFVNNTGDLDVCFDIDFYVYPSDGGFWNGSSELLCLDVGETGYETLNWTVPSGAPAGYYNAFVYVLDFETGTQLDYDREDDAFNVYEESRNYTLTVQVYDNDTNQIIRNAFVYLDDNLIGTTDLNGEISIFPVIVGIHTIKATKSEYYDGIITVNVSSNKTVPVYLVPIEQGNYTIRIQVYDNETGYMISNAEVYLDNIYKGKTDSDGEIFIFNVTGGSHTIKATKNDYHNGTRNIYVGPNTAFTIPLMPKTESVEGYVRNSVTGNPIVSAEVSIGNHTDFTDYNGYYLLEKLPLGTQTITASKSGYVPYSGNVTIIKNTQRTFNILLTPYSTGSVGGHINDSVTGDPVIGAEVNIGTYSDYTNSNGYYLLENIPIGKHELTASKSGYISHSENVTITDNTLTTLDISLQPSELNLPDYIVNNVEFEPYPTLYENITIKISLANIGGLDTQDGWKQITVKVYDGTIANEIGENTIHSDFKGHDLEVQWFPLSTGPRDIIVEVDATNTMLESNEKNNEWIKNVNVNKIYVRLVELSKNYRPENYALIVTPSVQEGYLPLDVDMKMYNQKATWYEIQINDPDGEQTGCFDCGFSDLSEIFSHRGIQPKGTFSRSRISYNPLEAWVDNPLGYYPVTFDYTLDYQDTCMSIQASRGTTYARIFNTVDAFVLAATGDHIDYNIFVEGILKKMDLSTRQKVIYKISQGDGVGVIEELAKWFEDMDNCAEYAQFLIFYRNKDEVELTKMKKDAKRFAKRLGIVVRFYTITQTFGDTYLATVDDQVIISFEKIENPSTKSTYSSTQGAFTAQSISTAQNVQGENNETEFKSPIINLISPKNAELTSTNITVSGNITNRISDKQLLAYLLVDGQAVNQLILDELGRFNQSIIVSEDYVFSWDDVPGNESGRLIDFLEKNQNLELIYVFSWDDVPGNDSDKLIGFLENDLNVSWVKNPTINKADDNRTINVSDGLNLITLELNGTENKITIEINGAGTYEYISKEEDGTLNMYNATLEKTEDNKTITLANGENLIILELNDTEHKATMEVNGAEVYEYILKEENSGLNLYSEAVHIITVRANNTNITLKLNNTNISIDNTAEVSVAILAGTHPNRTFFSYTGASPSRVSTNGEIKIHAKIVGGFTGYVNATVNDTTVPLIYNSTTGFFENVIFAPSVNGTYRINVAAINLTWNIVAQNNLSIITVENPSLIINEAYSDKLSYKLNESVTIYSLVQDENGNSISPDSIYATIKNPVGHVTQIVLNQEYPGHYSGSFINTTLLGEYDVTVYANKSGYANATYSFTFDVFNYLPAASITSPENGKSYGENYPITFEGFGVDKDSAINSFTWTSNIDGTLRINSNPACSKQTDTQCDDSFSISNLSVGTHIITLKIISDDNGFDIARKTINIILCSCSNCSDCTAKLSDPNCNVVALTVDITDHSGTCIDNPISFSNKIFNCQGYMIDGDESGNSYGIFTNSQNNITIQNCNITNFQYAIRVVKTHNSTFTNLKVSTFDRSQITAVSSYGIYSTGNNNGFFEIHAHSINGDDDSAGCGDNGGDAYGIYSSGSNCNFSNVTLDNINGGYGALESSCSPKQGDGGDAYGIYSTGSNNTFTGVRTNLIRGGYGQNAAFSGVGRCDGGDGGDAYGIYSSGSNNTFTGINTSNTVGFHCGYGSYSTGTTGGDGGDGGDAYGIYSTGDNNTFMNTNEYLTIGYSACTGGYGVSGYGASGAEGKGYGLYISGKGNKLISNAICSNEHYDIYNTYSKSGNNNTCNTINNWGDVGIERGCTFRCDGAACDFDNDFYTKTACNGTDCDDNNSNKFPGNPEICDGLDNDCDKSIDNGLTPYLNNSNQKGVCAGSKKTCKGVSGWQDDYSGIPYYEETELSCDGKDNDCDGIADDNLIAPNNTNQAGVCKGSTKTCKGALGWQDDYYKIGYYEETELSCDGMDNDCDGKIDNDLPTHLNSNQKGVCAGSKKTCSGASGWQDNYSGISDYQETETLCDKKDNDCDGEIDEYEGCRADLTIESLICSNESAMICDEVNITSVVKNLGFINASGLDYVRVYLFVDNVYEDSRTINLTGNDAGEVNFTWTAVRDAGVHNLKIFADYDNLIEEKNESNNFKSKNITVIIKPPVASNPSVVPAVSTVDVKTLFNYSIEVSDSYDNCDDMINVLLEVRDPSSGEWKSYSIVNIYGSGTAWWLVKPFDENDENMNPSYRFKYSDSFDQTGTWGEYDGPTILDEDTQGPVFNLIWKSGNVSSDRFYIASVEIEDPSGVLYNSTSPVCYYSYGPNVSDSNYAGYVSMSLTDTGLPLGFTGYIPPSGDENENKTIYFRIYAHDNDNSPARGDSGVIEGGKILDDDTEPPVIHLNSHYYPEQMISGKNISVLHIKINDKSGISNTTLKYSYNKNSWSTGTQSYSGKDWTFTILPQSEDHEGETLYFYVEACDDDNSKECSRNDNDGNYYNISILDEDIYPPFIHAVKVEETVYDNGVISPGENITISWGANDMNNISETSCNVTTNGCSSVGSVQNSNGGYYVIVENCAASNASNFTEYDFTITAEDNDNSKNSSTKTGTFRVYSNRTEMTTKFSDNSTSKIIVFEGAGSKVVNVTIPTQGEVIDASFDLYSLFDEAVVVLNLKSNPYVGGNWTVDFVTTGSGADALKVTAIDGTEFGVDIDFLGLYCGDEEVDFNVTGNEYFSNNWDCLEEGHIVNEVLTEGEHHLRVEFGDEVGFADNYAGCTCNTCDDCEVKLNDSGCTEVRLTTDINDYGGICINNPANFNNKIFDCQGHTIDGDGSGGDYGIYLDENYGNTIKNCVIQQFQYGIKSTGPTNTFLDITASDNRGNNGYHGSGDDSYGIYSSGDHVIFSNVIASSNYGGSGHHDGDDGYPGGYSYGIYSSGDYVTFSSVTTSVNRGGDSNGGYSGVFAGYGYGIYSSGDHVIFSNVIASSNRGGDGSGSRSSYGGTGYGVYVSGNDITFSDVTASYNHGGSGTGSGDYESRGGVGYGIYVSGNDITFSDVTASYNHGNEGWGGGPGGSGYGIYAPNNNIEFSHVTASSNYGAHGAYGAFSNPGHGGSGYGIYAPGSGVTFSYINASYNYGGDRGSGKRCAPGGQGYGIYTLSNNIEFVYVNASHNYAGSGANGNAHSNVGSGINAPGDNNIFLHVNASHNGGGAGVYCQDCNEHGSPGHGIYAPGNNIELSDIVTSYNYGGGAGTARNGGPGYGIYLSGDGSTFSDITASYNRGGGGGSSYSGPGYGIYLDSSSNNTLNYITTSSNRGGNGGYWKGGKSGGTGYGIYLDSSSNNNLNYITASSNRGGNGGVTYSSDYNGGDGGTGYGVYLFSSSNNNLNYITTSSNHGGNKGCFHTNPSYKCGVDGSGYGIYSHSSTSTIDSSIVCNNTNLDLSSSDWLSSSGDNNYCDKPDGWNDDGATGCTFNCPCPCSSCDDCETQLSNASCDVVMLTADISNYAGICINNPVNFSNKIFDCQGHMIDGVGNIFSWPPEYGIHLNGKSGNTLRNCIVNEFGWAGIRLESSSGNTVTSNTLNSNGVGIWVDYSSNNNIISNTANSNLYGIYFYSASNNNVNENQLCSNSNTDIDIRSGSGNTGDNNKCDKTSGWNDGGTTGCTYCCSDAGCPADTACADHYCSGGTCAVTYSDKNTLCDSTYRCSSGYGYNKYGTGGDYRCRGYCDDVSGNCINADDCTLCPTGATDSDGSLTAYTTAGTVTDYTGCSGGECTSTNYNDYCFSGTWLKEHGISGLSYTTGDKQCQDYENDNCIGGKYYRQEWGCSESPGYCNDGAVADTHIGTDTDGDGHDNECESCDYEHSRTSPATESGSANCNNGIDDDCDGTSLTEFEADYDTMDRGPAGHVPSHGDDGCPVGIDSISVSDSNPCPGETIEVKCKSGVGVVNSINAYIDSTLCTFIGWSGDDARFSCPVGSVGSKTVKCTVDATKSYQSENDKTTTITVGGPPCCSGYGTSNVCEVDSACDWCNECSGTKYSGGTNRCVTTGNCNYYCWKNKCGAACDGTQGGCDDTTRCNGKIYQTRTAACTGSCNCSYGSWIDGTCSESVSNCGAECDSDDDCGNMDCDYLDGCYGNIYRDYQGVTNTCQSGCTCTSGICDSYSEEIDYDTDGYSASCGDCNDSDRDMFPGNNETCDGKDNDCNGKTDCINEVGDLICNANWMCSLGSGDNKYSTGGDYLCQGYCDGSGSCDYAVNCNYCKDGCVFDSCVDVSFGDEINVGNYKRKLVTISKSENDAWSRAVYTNVPAGILWWWVQEGNDSGYGNPNKHCMGDSKLSDFGSSLISWTADALEGEKLSYETICYANTIPLSLDVGSDGDDEWKNSSFKNETINDATVPDIVNEMNDYKNKFCSSGSCNIPLNFTSSQKGKLLISNLRIYYNIFREESSVAISSSGVDIAEVMEEGGNLTLSASVAWNDIVSGSENKSINYTWMLDGNVTNQSTINSSQRGIDGNVVLQYNFTPNYTQGCTRIFDLIIEAGNFSTSRRWFITVYDVNRDPGIDHEFQIETNEDTPVNIPLNKSDPDGDTNLTWDISGVDMSLFNAEIGSDVLTITPVKDRYGESNLTLTLTDSGGAQDSKTLNVNITPVNDLPVITPEVPGIITEEDTPLTIDLTSYGMDVEDYGSGLVWSVSGVNENLFTASINTGTDELIVMPEHNKFGEDTVTLTLTDSDGGKTTQEINVKITPVNDPPINEIADISFDEDNVSAKYLDLEVSDIETSSNDLKISVNPVKNLDAVLAAVDIDNNTHLLTITPVENAYGSDTMIIDVTDADNKTTSRLVKVTINPVNDMPSIDSASPENNVTITEGESQTFEITKSDPDGTVPKVKWYLDSSRVSTGDSYVYFSDYGSAGTYNVTVLVSDETMANSHEWTLNVNYNPDYDNDGVSNENDTCPGTHTGKTVDLTGCSCSQKNCAEDQFCDALAQCQNLNCSEGDYPFNHTCEANMTYCPIHTNCLSNETCNTTNNKCQTLNCPTNHEPFNHHCYHNCDRNYDKIHVHNWDDLMTSYKCFLGIKNCNNYYQNWNLIKQEYECFVNAQ